VRIALVSREIHPYVGGGIAPIVTAAAGLLSEVAEVTLFTSGAHRDKHLEAATETPYEIVWVDEPLEGASAAYLSHMHHYSARVHAALRSHYGARGPELIEFCDYLAEGFVTVQAKQTLAPWLEQTQVAVRLHTTAEIVNVLNGHVLDDSRSLATYEAERFCLRHADVILWSGGDVYDTYRRFYGADAVAPGVRLPDAFLREGEVERATGMVPREDGPLRMLYLGRMERRKGVHNLLRAVTALESDDWSLRMIGGDTRTGPMGGSVGMALELAAAGDPRIELLAGMPRAEVIEEVRGTHVLVVPSLWECWPNTAREALMLNRPVLASPVGGLLDLARPGVSGLLAREASAEALQAEIERLLEDRSPLASMIQAGGPRQVFDELTDPGRLVEGYRELASARRPRPARTRPQPPLVSIVVPYFKLERFVAETLASVAAQTHPAIETLLVVDGSLREEDGAVIEAAEAAGAQVITQVNSGLGPARNFGIAHSRGTYVLPLDADDVIAPELVERCADVLEREPALDYVTTWVEYIGPDGTPLTDENGGWMPYGNWTRLNERNNVAGTCTALFRRSLFDAGFAYSSDLTSYEDWLLYLELQDAGRHGGVVPERLFRYRVREESMMRKIGAKSIGRIAGEVHALRRERAMRWTPAAEVA
jgi:glycosyltransferase involved in cell wall biosynthesis